MRKVLVVAVREYNAAVRTRAFLIGILMMPLLMGGSILVQARVGNRGDTKDVTVAFLDRTPGKQLAGALQEAAAAYNASGQEPGTERLTRGKVRLEDAEGQSEEELRRRAKRGELAAWLVIGPDVIRGVPGGAGKAPPEATVVYETVRIPDQDFLRLVRERLNAQVRELRAQKAGLPLQKVLEISRSVPVEMNREAFQPSIMVPVTLMMLMFMLVLMTTTPMMQGVVEEKMQRIAEVLLGSLSPFQLMLGKLLGMTAVSLTISAVYLGGAYWAAHHYGMAEYASWGMIGWFLTFQTLASLMYGALFIAVGAACTDTRETQVLMWPVMLLACLPMFLLGPILRAPNSGLVVGMSFFPFATPNMMIARQAMPGGVPAWQPVVGALGVLAMTLVCVWAAGRIFRVGILMMGKGASPTEIARWVLRG